MTGTIALWGNFGAGNWGNECTLEAVVHNLRRRMPEARLVCVCSDPEDVRRRHGIEAVPIGQRRRDAVAGMAWTRGAGFARRASGEVGAWWSALGLARGVDAMLMTGTGMLSDVGEGAFGLPYELFMWSSAVRARGGRVAFASVGVEPIEDPLTKFFLFAALRMADYRSYRDQPSRDRLREIGFEDPEAAVYPDLAFSLPESATAARLSRPRPARSTVAVGLFDYRGRGQHGGEDAVAYRAYLDKIGGFVLWLLERGHAVRLLIGDLTYDEPVLRDVREWLAAHGGDRHSGRIEDEPARSVEDVMDQIAGVDLVVASRFHNVLLALLLGRPVLSIAYNEKNDALMERMGLGTYCDSIDRFALDLLCDRFEGLRREAPRLRPLILAKGAAFRRDLDRQYDALFPPAPQAREPRPDHASAKRV